MKFNTLLVLVCSVVWAGAQPNPIRYNFGTTNSNAGLTNAVRDVASTLRRDMDANGKSITNANVIEGDVVVASPLLINDGSAALKDVVVSGLMTGKTIIATNFVGNGGGLTNLPASSGTNNAYLVGNTTELLNALNLVNQLNATVRRIQLLGKTTYKIGAPLIITNGGVEIEGVMGFDASGNNVSSVIEQTNSGMSAIELVVDGTENIVGGALRSFVVKGYSTNDNTPGIFIGAGSSSYTTLQNKLEQLHVSGFGSGILMSNAVHITIDSCTSVSNRFAAIRAENIGGELSIMHPHIGWGQTTNSWCLYVGSQYSGGQCDIMGMGGEMGVGSRWIYMAPDAGELTWFGGNYEAQNTSMSPIVYMTNMAEAGFYGTRIAGTGTATVFDLRAGDVSAVKLFCSVQGFTGLLADCYQHGGVNWFPLVVGGQSCKLVRSVYGSTTNYFTNTYSGNIPTFSDPNTWVANQYLDGRSFFHNGAYDGISLGANITASPMAFTAGANHGVNIVGARFASDYFFSDPFTLLSYDAGSTGIELNIGGGGGNYAARVGPTTINLKVSPFEGSNSVQIVNITTNGVDIRSNLTVEAEAFVQNAVIPTNNVPAGQVSVTNWLLFNYLGIPSLIATNHNGTAGWLIKPLYP